MSRKIELSAAYARLTLQSGVATPAQLLSGTTLTEDAVADMEFIEASELGMLFRNYDRCVDDRSWTARLGTQFNIAAHGPLGFAALSAPTLGEAMDVIGSLIACRNTAVTLSTSATETHYCLEVEPVTGEPDFDQWLVEVVLKVTETLLASILGHPVGKNVLITFTHPAPLKAKRLVACFDAAVAFSAPRNSIAVPLAWRQLPSPLHDESVYRANLIKCRELIATREQETSVTSAVRNQLRNHFDSQLSPSAKCLPPPTLDQIADVMHLTSRTLIRRLQREKTAYKELLENLRQEYAGHLLQHAGLKITDVADVLGYREAANFCRAFKRWHGISPTAWRRR